MRRIYLIILGIIISNLTFSQFSNIEFRDVFSTDSLSAWVVGDYGTILKVTDAGQSMEDYSYNTDLSLNSIYFTNIQKGFIAGDSGLILQTIDGGTSWTQIDLGDLRDFRSVSFVDEQNGWISTPFNQGAGLYKTINGGENWDYIDSTIFHPFFIDTNNGWGKLWVGGPSIVGTNDGGHTWSFLSSFLGIWLHDIQFVDLMNGIYTTNDMGGGPLLYKTNDGGINWIGGYINVYADILNLVDIENGWIGGRQGIYYSNDFFETWIHFLTNDQFVNSLSVHGPSNGWAVSFNYYTEEGAIWKLDGTNNWIQIELVGLNDNYENKATLYCYPNPTKEFALIEFDLKKKEEITLMLHDINGKELERNPLGKQIKGQFKLDIGDLPSGIYFVKLQTDSRVITEKIIKE